ncbi:MAG: BatA and WFA domain-containing protein [Phycisphaerae bacterium]|nr:BatA and WFA domain-containing protein [Phycisphaerae bacterium]
MNFLRSLSALATPWTALIAAGVAIPSLLLFYFLKLRRQERAISSTLLWKQAIQDLQVNSPFQKLRNNLLLWLQLLALIIAILCLLQPVARSSETTEKSVILLVDQSGSMATREGDGKSRLDLVKEAAKTYVDNLDDRSKAMVILFSDRARVASPFTTDKQALRQHIDGIEQTDCSSRLGDALQLAEAHSTRQIISSGGADIPPESPTDPAEMVLFSDGRIEDAGQAVLRRGGLTFAKIGQASDNVGILGIDARRNYERPEELSIFVTIGNFGDKAIKSDLTLKIDGRTLSVGEVSLGPAPPEDSQPGATSRPALSLSPGGGQSAVGAVPFKLTYDTGGVVEVILHRPDALDTDNHAWLVVEPPRRLRVLLVTGGNYFLKRALDSLPLKEVKEIDPGTLAASRDLLAPGGRLSYDVAIMDRCSPENLPEGNYLFFGAVPKVEGVGDAGLVEGEYIYDWNDQHPILRHVVLNYLSVSKWRRMELPKRAIRLVEGETSPVIALLSAAGSRYLIVAFDVYDSNWPLRISFPIFIYNAVRHLSDSLTRGPSQSIPPGVAMSIPVPTGADALTVTRPDGRKDDLTVGDRQAIYFRDTRHLGVYRVQPSLEGYEAFAVNLLNPTESNVRPNAGFKIGTEKVATGETVRRQNQPLWPWLMLAVLGVLLVEWIIYNRRMFV